MAAEGKRILALGAGEQDWSLAGRAGNLSQRVFVARTVSGDLFIGWIETPLPIHHQLVGVGARGKAEREFPGVFARFFHRVGSGVPAVEGAGHAYGLFRTGAEIAELRLRSRLD